MNRATVRDTRETARSGHGAPWLLLSLLFLSGCSLFGPADPAEAPVAILDGRTVTRADLDAYLRENLPRTGEEDSVEEGDPDVVKSRLFDNFLDEEILLAEARRRKVTVSEAEIDAYLGELGAGSREGEAPAPRDEEERRRARRNLSIQRLRDAFALRPSLLDAAEIETYLAAHREELRAKPTVVFRAFPVASPADAPVRGKEIEKMKPRLERAARTGEDLGPEYGLLQEASIADLPEEYRAAIEALRPGEASAPATLDGDTWIFYLVAGPTPVVEGEETLRERAREALARDRVEDASARQLAVLKIRSRIEIRPENLGFRYVPEPASRDAAGAGKKESE